jgi:hypothetical protein
MYDNQSLGVYQWVKLKYSSRWGKLVLLYLLYMLSFKWLIIMGLGLPGPWGPALTAAVPNGTRLIVKCRRVGKESDELLICISRNTESTYVINNTHALDLWYAKVCLSQDGSLVWIESRWSVIATLNLDTGEFYSEGVSQPDGAVFGAGATLSQGWTRYWWELVMPF